MAFNYFRFCTCFVFLLHPQIISPISVYIYRGADTDLKHPSLLPPQAQERPTVLKATSALRLGFTGSILPSSLASCPFSTFLGHRAIPTAQVGWPSLHTPLRAICIYSWRKYTCFRYMLPPLTSWLNDWNPSAVGRTSCDGRKQQIAYAVLSFTIQIMASKHVAHESNLKFWTHIFSYSTIHEGRVPHLSKAFFSSRRREQSTRGIANNPYYLFPKKKKKGRNKQPPFKK